MKISEIVGSRNINNGTSSFMRIPILMLKSSNLEQFYHVNSGTEKGQFFYSAVA